MHSRIILAGKTLRYVLEGAHVLLDKADLASLGADSAIDSVLNIEIHTKGVETRVFVGLKDVVETVPLFSGDKAPPLYAAILALLLPSKEDKPPSVGPWVERMEQLNLEVESLKAEVKRLSSAENSREGGVSPTKRVDKAPKGYYSLSSYFRTFFHSPSTIVLDSATHYYSAKLRKEKGIKEGQCVEVRLSRHTEVAVRHYPYWILNSLVRKGISTSPVIVPVRQCPPQYMSLGQFLSKVDYYSVEFKGHYRSNLTKLLDLDCLSKNIIVAKIDKSKEQRYDVKFYPSSVLEEVVEANIAKFIKA